jgi:tetratricopeptide (TPR) repeat protein
MALYQCTNLGNCNKADSKEKITLPAGSDSACPECGKPLTEVGEVNPWKRRLIIFAVILATGLGGVTVKKLFDFISVTNNGAIIIEIKIGINTYINIKSDEELQTTELNIFDPEGKTIFENKWEEKKDNKSAKYEITLPTDKWNPGTYKYLVKVSDKQKSKEKRGEFSIAPGSPPPPKLKSTPDRRIEPPPIPPTTIPLEAQVNLQQGMQYASGKDYENAIKEFTLSIEKYPNYATAYSNRAVAYMQQKKYNKAQEDLDKAVGINPDDPLIHYNITALRSLTDKLDIALDSLDKCLELGFNDVDSLRNDPDLKNLRKHPEYRKILDKHKIFIH